MAAGEPARTTATGCWFLLLCTWLALAGSACRPPDEPVRVDGRRLVVENTTGEDWMAVEIWINDYYRATVPEIPAGGRFDAPLDGFVTGFGHRFDPQRASVTGVEVSAASANGREVKVVWGTGRRR